MGALPKKSVMFKEPVISKLLPVPSVAEDGNKRRWFLLRKYTGTFLDFPEEDPSAKGDTKRSM